MLSATLTKDLVMLSRPRRGLIFCVLCGLLSTLGAAILLIATCTPSGAADAVGATQSRLTRDLTYIASDELEGRGIGTAGLDLAGEYIRSQFAQAGLELTSVKGSPFQKFQATTGATLGQPNQLIYRDPNGNAFQWNQGSDFQPLSFGGSGQFTGKLVFCGYGIDAPDKKYSDFIGIDVKGKVVIIMRRNPQQNLAGGPFTGAHGGMSMHSELRTKVSNAATRGAAAILFVNDPASGRQDLESARKRLRKLQTDMEAAVKARDAIPEKEVQKRTEADQKVSALQSQIATVTAEEAQVAARGVTDTLMKFGYAGDEPMRSIPILHITRAACNYVLQGALKTDLDTLEKAIDGDLKPRSSDLKGWSAEGVVTIHRTQSDVKNIIGVIPGKGPHADETVVIGAHYDHIGRGGFGSLAPGSNEIHNGADDNGSGTVALLEIARRLGARKEKLSRRIVIIAFTAEESGLIGSARYVRDPVFPLNKTVAMINMDMVGRLQEDKLTIFGTGTSPIWDALLKRLAEPLKFRLIFKPEGYGPSDHMSFYAKQIPVLHFFTGSHGDYHRPSDDVEKINLPGIGRIVDLVEQTAVAIADAPERPPYVEVKGMASIFRDTSRPYFGSIPDYSNDEKGSLLLTGVSPGSPADKGGLKGGDRIVQFGKMKVENINDYDLALRKCEPGELIEVIVLRGKEKLSLKVTLAKPRGH